MVADAHLDTQWNWDIQTTIKEYVWNTLSRNLSLLKRYPDYIFNFEGGVKYAWMKEYYPDEYEQIKPFVREGRWHLAGSSWEASDVLVSSVESSIRNILLGQTFYRKEFGAEGTDIFLPDCFGFGWTLPTIAKHCGLIGFSSQKLAWRNHPFYGNDKIPFTLGLWKGVDGSALMFAHGYDYISRWDNVDLSKDKALLELAGRSPLNTVYHYYGTGDTGGSPSIGSVNSVVKGMHSDGALEIISSTSDRLFKAYVPFDKHPELPVFDGELLMDVHGTGCYTSQAAMKLYNRQNEQLGDAAERAAVAADCLGAAAYPGRRLTEAWQRFIFHQFHDDLTGTSIPRAYEFSWNDELLSLKEFSGILTASVGAVAEKMDTRVKGTPVVCYNALGFPVTDVVEVTLDMPILPQSTTVYNAEGKQVRAQLLSAEGTKTRLLLEASVPATGFAVYDVRFTGRAKQPVASTDATTLENSVYKITLNAQGDITSLIDKRSDKEMVQPGKAIRLALFTDNKSYSWPAWEIMKSTLDHTPVSITENVTMKLVENGALRKVLCVEKQHDRSTFRQYICLYEGTLADRIDFYNEVDWQSSGALLKAEFPLNVENEKATYDLGVGTVQRGNNTRTAYEVYAQHWADLTDQNDNYGVSVMNDSKYGWDKPDNHTLRLTLLHTPETKNNYPYQNRQDFGHHTFTYSIVGHDGALNVAQTGLKGELLNQRVKAFSADRHAGVLGKSFSMVASDNDNVVIKTLKKAEVSDEYVVRVYETGGKSAQKAMLTFAGNIVEAHEADGTEKSIGSAVFHDNQLEVSIEPYSIKTYKLKINAGEVAPLETTMLELPFDRKCFSWNGFAGEANFAGGYSYAVELIPSELTVDRIPFRLETKEEKSGLTCRGNRLTLPADNRYNRLYILAAATTDGSDAQGEFRVGKSVQQRVVPSYTGFIGQWGHLGHTTGYFKETEVAYTGTHRHSSEGDHPYEFTYMFKIALDIPDKATEVVLPDNPDIVIFAATLVKEAHTPATALSTLFRTSINNNRLSQQASRARVNLLKPEMLVGWSGFVNDVEQPKFLLDGNDQTKWCDTSLLPNYVDFDLGKEQTIGSWEMLGAGHENSVYVTSACFLLGRNSPTEEWRTLDFVTGNRQNVLARSFGTPQTVRYLRLMVTQPVQAAGEQGTRIYELAVYE
ncbi:MAG: discoidin domain-containing protein [Mediterranea sp.]|nr:discoidin domain-containing protein [Mediterranea sp.]